METETSINGIQKRTVFAGLLLIGLLLAGLTLLSFVQERQRVKIQEGCLIQEDKNYLYVCSAYRVAKIDKKTNEQVILWENCEIVKKRKELLYAKGSGLLLGDDIYFVEGVPKDSPYAEEFRVLSTVKTDGSGYRRLEDLQHLRDSFFTRFPSLKYVNGIIYVEESDFTKSYLVGADGSYQGTIENWQIRKAENLPEECGLPYYPSNGSRCFYPAESKEVFGYYLMDAAGMPGAIVKVQNGESTLLVEGSLEDISWSFEGYNKEGLLFQRELRGENTDIFYMMNPDTMELREVVRYPQAKYAKVVSMDEHYLYLAENPQITENYADYNTVIYSKVDLKTGEITDVCTISDAGQRLEKMAYEYSDQLISGGYLYYVGQRGAAFYLMRRNVEAPDTEEVLGDAIFDSGIDTVGEKDFLEEKLYWHDDPKPENMTGIVTMEYLQIDEKFSGADKINALMKEYITSYREQQLQRKEQYGLYGDVAVNEISYFDGTYLSFSTQLNGFFASVCDSFTFNVNTGERLWLWDVINESESEWMQIVMDSAEALVEAYPQSFEKDALLDIRRSISLETNFALENDGIHFYVADARRDRGYDLFELVIPYEKFDMRIPVGTGGPKLLCGKEFPEWLSNQTAARRYAKAEEEYKTCTNLMGVAGYGKIVPYLGEENNSYVKAVRKAGKYRGDKLVHTYEADYNGDAEREAYILIGEEKNGLLLGKIWFVNAEGDAVCLSEEAQKYRMWQEFVCDGEQTKLYVSHLEWSWWETDIYTVEDGEVKVQPF